MRTVIPTRGVTGSTAAIDQPAQFSAPTGEKNVALFTPPNGRPQIGQRPGLVKVSPIRMGKDGNRAVQQVRTISRASAVTGFDIGTERAVLWRNVSAQMADVQGQILLAPIGRVGLIDNAKIENDSGKLTLLWGSSINGAAYLDDSGSMGMVSTPVPVWVAVHPSGTLAAVGMSYTDGTGTATLVVLVDPVDLTVIGSASIGADSADDVGTLGGCFTEGALWIVDDAQLVKIPIQQIGDTFAPLTCRHQFLTPATVTGMPSSTVGTFTGICSRKLSDVAWTLFACFTGNTASGSYLNPSGSVSADTPAKHFRAGVVRLTESDGALSVVPIGGAITAADPYVEVDGSGILVQHASCRFSQWLDRSPRGCLPTSIAAMPDSAGGGFVVSFTNDGWGPDTSLTPDGGRAATVLARFDDDGTEMWEIDLNSVIAGEAGGKRVGSGTTYPCDIPNEDGTGTTKDGPAIRAVAIDPAGLIYAAGRVATSRYNVFCVEPAGGMIRWRARTESNNPTTGFATWVSPGTAGAGTPRGGLAIDPSDGQLLAVGRRNRTYGIEDAYSAWAATFKMEPLEGSITWAWSPTSDDAGAAVEQPVAVGGSSGNVAVVVCPNWADT